MLLVHGVLHLLGHDHELGQQVLIRGEALLARRYQLHDNRTHMQQLLQ